MGCHFGQLGVLELGELQAVCGPERCPGVGERGGWWGLRGSPGAGSLQGRRPLGTGTVPHLPSGASSSCAWGPLNKTTATTRQVCPHSLLVRRTKLLPTFVASCSCFVGSTRGSTCMGAFPQVFRKNLPFSDNCQKVAWRHLGKGQGDIIHKDKLW